jgi:hypothetical protein
VRERSTIRESGERGTVIGQWFEWTTLLVAALMVGAVLVDTLRLSVNAASVGGIAGLLLVPLIYVAVSRAGRDRLLRWRGDLLTDVLLLGVVGVLGWHLLAPTWPALLPVGNSPDAVHHTALANYIFEQRQLVRDPEMVSKSLIEMADYPPGFAVLTAVIAEFGATRPVRVIYPLAALTVIAGVLGCALLIVATVPGRVRAVAAAIALAALTMPEYILGAVAYQSYYPQMLAQWLLVTVGYVLVAREGASRVLHLALLLLALLVAYTTWLPVALVAVTLSLLLQRGGWPQRLWQAGVVVMPVALLALAYSWTRAATGGAVILHEGSTIRDPLGVTGVLLPALALLGVLTAWREPRRQPVLWLIVAAALQVAGLWWLWQRGQIAGYIYYKGYYLLALLLVVPIGWLLTDGVGWMLGRRPSASRVWLAIQVAVVLVAIGSGLALPGLPSAWEPAEHPLSPALLEAARWVREHGTPDDTDYALQKPGSSAYWVHVGLLGQPRTAAAHALLTTPPNFLEWYFHPVTTRMLLLEQPVAPEPHLGLAVRFQNACCTVLEKTDQYEAALQELRPLMLSYSASFAEGKQQINLEVFDALNQPDLRVRLVAQGADGQPLATYQLDVPQRAGRVQYLGFAFDPQTLAATGYANNAPGSEWPALSDAPGSYRVLLQLLKQDTVVREQDLGTCCIEDGRWQPTIVHPHMAWAYFRPPQTSVAASRDLTLGQEIGVIAAEVERATVQPDESLTVRLRWQARQTITRRYTTFVQLIAADGNAAVSVEGEPNQGATPTWRWQAGDLIDDVWQLKLPANLQAGQYQVVVGMYDPVSGERLEAWQQHPSVERFWTNALPLGVVEVRR